jgi:hypothetical protein
METKRCSACDHTFRPRPQTPHQRFCSDPACQRERRRRWQLEKRGTDPDYQDNQARAQHAWAERHPDYWDVYRQAHPEYVERNRARQHDRDAGRACGRLAKMDASLPVCPLASGTYRLRPVVAGNLAKMDVWTVKITVISDT